MTENANKIPSVFISYAWSEETDEWVLRLAHRLVEDEGFDVILDKWDLGPGQDMYAFMEKSAKDPDNFVLLICDENYQKKANDRTGGVGTETQVLSHEIYKNVNQSRVVAVVRERDDNGNTFLPSYMEARIYFDLSSPNCYEEGLEQLVRHFRGKPIHRRPKRGQLRSFEDDQSTYFSTHKYIGQVQAANKQGPNAVKALTNNFFTAFLDELEKFKYVHNQDVILDEAIYIHIKNMLPLRNDYIHFLEAVYDNYGELDNSQFVYFFEKLYQFTTPDGFSGSFYEEQFDHFKFLIRELSLFTVMILIKGQKYDGLFNLLNSTYFLHRRGELIPSTFDSFRLPCRSLNEIRNSRLDKRKYSLTADILINERLTNKFSKIDLIQADHFVYYFGVLRDYDTYQWYPETCPYEQYSKFPIIQMLQSRDHCERTMKLFNASTIDELKEKISSFKNAYDGYDIPIRGLQFHVEVEKIGLHP